MEKVGPEGSKVFLAEFTGRDDLPLAELLLDALNKLPRTGDIRGKRDGFVIKSIGWLKAEIPDSDLRKSEINRRFNEVLSRTPWVVETIC